MHGRHASLNLKTARREFLATLPGAFLSVATVGNRSFSAEDSLHVLKGEDTLRLRLDFNASRSKVRLFLLLSPT